LMQRLLTGRVRVVPQCQARGKTAVVADQLGAAVPGKGQNSREY
jgi:hypothetical protein